MPPSERGGHRARGGALRERIAPRAVALAAASILSVPLIACRTLHPCGELTGVSALPLEFFESRDTNGDGRDDWWEAPGIARIDVDLDGSIDLWVSVLPTGEVDAGWVDPDGDGEPETRLDRDETVAAAEGRIPDTGILPDRPPALTDCEESPTCSLYLRRLRRRLLSQWVVPPLTHEVSVRVRFGVDVRGCPHAVTVTDSDSDELARSVVDAFRSASPLPTPPRPLRHQASGGLSATFSLRAD